ncbi:MAG: hypothetical protein J6C54_04930 [Lachnospiraceae bacterium]|nr:hypothetical protein [Lachnospiraceae bacterium]
MKVVRRVFFSLVAFLLICRVNCIDAFAATDSSDGMTVVAELADEKLDITISGIEIVEKDQILTYSLVSEDTAAGILYANAVYVNGQTVMTERISISGEELTEEKLKSCVLTVQNVAGEQLVSIRFAPEETPESTPTPTPESTPTPTPESTPTSASGQESTPTEVPVLVEETNTGDASNIWISICMLVISSVVMVVLLLTYSQKAVCGRTTEKED